MKLKSKGNGSSRNTRFALALLLIVAFSMRTNDCCAQTDSNVDYAQVRDPIELSPEVLAAERNRIAAIERASQAAVGVFGAEGSGGGSGVLITPDGFALTNYHVVQGNGPFMKCSLPDGVLYDCVIVGIDPVGDVAMIKLLGRDDFPVAELGDSDTVRQGEMCFAVGNPFLLATDFQPTVSFGIVSGVHRYQYPSGTLLEYADCIQTDAAINPGNSGGPLFNSTGQLIGINGRGSFEKRGRVNVGVGYAISINQIKLFHDHLLSGRIVDHATLGATVGTNESGEVRVTNILDSSDAFQQGLRFDDRIVAFGGRNIETVNQFKNVLGIFPRAWRVPLIYERDGLTNEVAVRLAGVHSEESLAAMVGGAPVPEIIPRDEKPNGEPDDAENKIDEQEPENPDSNPEDPKQSLFVQRHGFANYFFNLNRRDEIWQKLVDNGDFRTGDDKWRITATDSTGREMVIVLSDDQSGLQMGDETWLFDANEDFLSQLDSGNTNLLIAFHFWRRMLVLGPAKYGDSIYFGSLPVASIVEPVSDQPANGANGEFNSESGVATVPAANGGADAVPELRITNSRTADVINSTFDITRSGFYFDGATGHLLLMELFPDVSAAPSELYFSDYQLHEDLSVPGTIHVVSGNGVPQRLTVERFEFLNDGEAK